MNVYQTIGDRLRDVSKSLFTERSRRRAGLAGCVALITCGLAVVHGLNAAAVATLEDVGALSAVAPAAGGLAAGGLTSAGPAQGLRGAGSDGAATLALIGREVECLALNIYFEARSESDIGKRAVGYVVMNRVADPRFPDSVCAVVQQGGEWPLHRCQFSWWCDGLSDEPKDRRAWARSKTLAQQIYWGRSADPTNGALWYHADYVAPAWGQVLAQAGKIGRHIFYLDSNKRRVQIASAYGG